MIKKIRLAYEARTVKRNAARRERKQAIERARLIAKFQPSFEVSNLINTLENNSYVPTGSYELGFTKMLSFAKQDQMILIQCHLTDGRLSKVFREINENNLSVLAVKLTEKDGNIVDILDDVNLALGELTKEWPPEREAQESMPVRLALVRQFLTDAGMKLLKIENI
jgi:hypothetical protein